MRFLKTLAHKLSIPHGVREKKVLKISQIFFTSIVEEVGTSLLRCGIESLSPKKFEKIRSIVSRAIQKNMIFDQKCVSKKFDKNLIFSKTLQNQYVRTEEVFYKHLQNCLQWHRQSQPTSKISLKYKIFAVLYPK